MKLHAGIFKACLVCCLTMTTVQAADHETRFRSLFNGESLEGWSGNKDYWRVSDGMLIGESTADNPLKQNEFLVWSLGEVDDFELKLKFRISGTPAANSGIQFRGVQAASGQVVGYQADIDKAGEWTGMLYDEAARGILAKRGETVVINEKGESQVQSSKDAAELLKHINLDDWNEYRIIARGNRITLAINGQVTSDITDNDPEGLDRSGVLALQLHTGPPMKVEFRDIELKRLPLEQNWKKIVFVAGTPSHPYFTHEHNAGCLLLASKLMEAQQENGLPVIPVVYKNGWPKDPTAFDNANTVVSYCDGGGGHYLNSYLQEFDRLVEQRGMGLVCIHYAVETTKGEAGDHFLKWIGGFFEPFWSVNPHWTANFAKLPEHQITRGVSPFEIHDEWYYHMRFQPEMEGVTPILSDLPPRDSLNRPDGAHSGNPYVREAVMEREEPQHVAWAYERPDGNGRGFGFTGGHFHRNWQHDEFRKIVLNAIIWTAGLDVPEEGVITRTPTQEEMEANQDGERPEGFRFEPVPQRKAVSRSESFEIPKPVFSSDKVTTLTPAHAVEIKADISGKKKLYLIVTDAGDGYACDWVCWASPTLITDDGQQLKLTELQWVSADADFGKVQIGLNSQGESLHVNDQPVSFGIGTHATSVIEYDLPEDHSFTRLEAVGGIERGGAIQNNGRSSSVQFHVFTEDPARWMRLHANVRQRAEVVSHELSDAVQQIQVHPALTANLFAAEPVLANPSSIDVDHLGRVWVCEAINYRGFNNKDIIGENPEPDRILILEDTDGDGVSDKTTVFYQGEEVNSAHGVLVLPTPGSNELKVLISAGDKIFYLIDEDGDLQADRSEVLFTGIGGSQHDHGIHAVHFGPDGKLYFNFGNEGRQIKDRNGQPIIDMAGNEVNNSRQPYQEGMAFRCNLDGSQFETLAWNFRNNWELCVDSFGTVWQSDNDDDGNRAVRLNYLMEFGNFGFRDELTGAGWTSPRTGWEEDIPSRHWHLNDPGVVPNLIITGAGAPTGICIYEGDLFPADFHNAVLHCDAGPNICNAFQFSPRGAGYSSEVIPLMDGFENKWFRPSDICVAPDGSVFVADWYDPGVGAHRMLDAKRGRLFRLLPQKELLPADFDSNKIAQSNADVSTPAAAIHVLKSPNMSARSLAWQALYGMGEQAKPELQKLLTGNERAEIRVRALWLLVALSQTPDELRSVLNNALTQEDARIRTATLRAASLRALPDEKDNISQQDRQEILKQTITTAVEDADPAVRRQAAISLRYLDQASPALWTALANQHSADDRWSIEALGIAAHSNWNEYLAEWFNQNQDNWKQHPAAHDIIWRSRADTSANLISELIKNQPLEQKQILRMFRALDYQPAEKKQEAALDLAFSNLSQEQELLAVIRSEAMNRVQDVQLNENPQFTETLNQLLNQTTGSQQFINLVDKFRIHDRYPELLQLALTQPDSQLGVEAVRVLYDHDQSSMIHGLFQQEDQSQLEQAFRMLTMAADQRSVGFLMSILNDDNQSTWMRQEAIKALGGSVAGGLQLLAVAQSGNYPEFLKPAMAATLTTLPWTGITDPASQLFPPPPGKDSQPLPSLLELAERVGNLENGRVIFHTTGTCAKCHQVNGIGQDIGPNLSEIGKKLGRQAMFESILYPSAGISHGYETWLIITDAGQIFNGIIVSETDTSIQLKDEKGIIRTIETAAIEERRKQDISMMPADLQRLMTTQELIDVVEYMMSLRERKL